MTAGEREALRAARGLYAFVQSLHGDAMHSPTQTVTVTAQSLAAIMREAHGILAAAPRAAPGAPSELAVERLAVLLCKADKMWDNDVTDGENYRELAAWLLSHGLAALQGAS